MAQLQIRMKDRVFARMLEIVLFENGIEAEITSEKEAKIPEDCALVITEPRCADKSTLDFDKVIFICKGDERVTNERVLYRRPFLISVFVSEIQEMLFLKKKTTASEETIFIDKKQKKVRYGKLSASLTETELKLLVLLYENKGNAVTTEEIVARVFDGKTVDNSNVAAVYVNYLRKKLDERIGKRIIFAVRGVGYMLKDV